MDIWLTSFLVLSGWNVEKGIGGVCNISVRTSSPLEIIHLLSCSIIPDFLNEVFAALRAHPVITLQSICSSSDVDGPTQGRRAAGLNVTTLISLGRFVDYVGGKRTNSESS
ncbi:hypothetical protein K443DRAFT_123954 [Laccaria amethystina LaAM-08-1]|uniref:Uncharacterized protein n=1 Tax=Laccaria amethystina LaAM-08-1 TaxID=1095629 RepID=A0A0C9WM39_9AGAR|nr:hypothetical protein K443DRAFT_123954 [Laccaria amethystina LaAM-08-1]